MPKLNEHELWLTIAENDLRSAKTLMRDNLFNTAIYHCQQAAEKALKGYLAFKEQETQKTHDLIALVKQCLRIDTSFQCVIACAEELKPWSTRSRYPDDYVEIEHEEMQHAIDMAEYVLLIVKSKLD